MEDDDPPGSARDGCPILVTDRLVLRPPHVEDTDALACLANNKAVATMVSRMPHPYSRKDAADFIRRARTGAIGKCVYAVTLADTGRLLGCCGVEPQDEQSVLELGYWIGEAFWGKGYATEACHAVIDMAFRTRPIDCVDVRCRVTNQASRRVIHKSGFQFQGTGMVHSLALASTVPVEWYRLDRSTWISLRSWVAA